MIDGTTHIRVKCKQELWDLLFKEAVKKGVGIGELATQVLANHVGKKRLAEVPRGRPGRPKRSVVNPCATGKKGSAK